MNQRLMLRFLAVPVLFIPPSPTRVFAQEAAAVTCKDGTTGKAEA